MARPLPSWAIVRWHGVWPTGRVPMTSLLQLGVGVMSGHLLSGASVTGPQYAALLTVFDRGPSLSVVEVWRLLEVVALRADHRGQSVADLAHLDLGIGDVCAARSVAAFAADSA